MVWPVPVPVTIRLYPAGSTLILPVRPERAPEEALPDFPEPEAAAAVETESLVHRGRNRLILEDPSTGMTTVQIRRMHREFRLPHIDLRVRRQGDERFLIHAEDPLLAGAESSGEWSLERGAWRVRTETRLRMSADAEAFTVAAELDAFEGDEPIVTRRWERRIPRKLL
jgi:hypothetical protein